MQYPKYDAYIGNHYANRYRAVQLWYCLGALILAIYLQYIDDILDELLTDQGSLILQSAAVVFLLYMLSGLWYGMPGVVPGASTISATNSSSSSSSASSSSSSSSNIEFRRVDLIARGPDVTNLKHPPHYSRHTLDDNFRSTGNATRRPKTAFTQPSNPGNYRDNIALFKFKGEDYTATPSNVARASHVMKHGLMLRTDDAIEQLEAGSVLKLSYSLGAPSGARGRGDPDTPPLDQWVDRLRIILYSHICDELTWIEKKGVPNIVPWVEAIYSVQPVPTSYKKNIGRLMRCESMQENIDGTSGGELTLSQLIDRILNKDWSSIQTKFPQNAAGLAKLRKDLDEFQRRSAIFVKMPAAGASHVIGGSSSTTTMQYSLPLAGKLWELRRQQGGAYPRLPLDSGGGGVSTRGGVGGGVMSMAEVAMGAFAHYWDERYRKTNGGSSSMRFAEQCYAASTDDLDHLSGPSVTIVLNGSSSGVNYDVFTTDDRGPTINEVGEGRYNCYHSIVFFLLFLYKCNTASAASKNVADGVLKDMTAALISGNTLSLKDYLKNYVAALK